MHIDLNSCFASIEQLADPHLRGKPIAVAAYDSPRGCIIAPSIEAKKLGIKVGMRVQEGRQICRQLVILQPDPDKYRSVHVKLKRLLCEYTDDISPKSIDEFVLNLEGYPAFKLGLARVAQEIKDRIRAEVGESLTVSIGIAPNRFLAKTAAGLHKPDGLDEINLQNYQAIYAQLRLMDLCGIKHQNCLRLQHVGVYTLDEFYRATPRQLKAAFQSVAGYWWYMRLRGWEIDAIDFSRRSFGNSFALPQQQSNPEELAPILHKLIEKTGQRLRKGQYACRGVHVALMYNDGTHWHRGMSLGRDVFDSREIYRCAFRLLCAAPYRKPVSILAESVYDLRQVQYLQLNLFENVEAQQQLTSALDNICCKWGNFIITPARMLGTSELVPDRISFGSVKELEEAIRG